MLEEEFYKIYDESGYEFKENKEGVKFLYKDRGVFAPKLLITIDEDGVVKSFYIKPVTGKRKLSATLVSEALMKDLKFEDEKMVGHYKIYTSVDAKQYAFDLATLDLVDTNMTAFLNKLKQQGGDDDVE